MARLTAETVKPYVKEGKVVEKYVRPIEQIDISPDPEFWGNHPPDVVFITTASTRKVINAFLQLNGAPSATGSTNALDHLRDQRLNVPNGNGSFEGAIFLGYLHGIAMYAVSTKGEEPGDSPQEAAQKKAEWFRKEWLKKHPELTDIMIVGLDGMDQPSTHDAPLSKLTSMESFPKKYYEAWKMSLELGKNGGHNEKVVRSWLEKFLRELKHLHSIINTTAVSVIDVEMGTTTVSELKLAIPIKNALLGNVVMNYPQAEKRMKRDPYRGRPIVVDFEASAGGLVQQMMSLLTEDLQDLLQAQANLVAANPLAVEYYAQLSSWVEDRWNSIEYLGLAILFHIMGMPLAYVEKVLYQTAQSRSLNEKPIEAATAPEQLTSLLA